MRGIGRWAGRRSIRRNRGRFLGIRRRMPLVKLNSSKLRNHDNRASSYVTLAFPHQIPGTAERSIRSLEKTKTKKTTIVRRRDQQPAAPRADGTDSQAESDGKARLAVGGVGLDLEGLGLED
jgi:hypothetical protein